MGILIIPLDCTDPELTHRSHLAHCFRIVKTYSDSALSILPSRDTHYVTRLDREIAQVILTSRTLSVLVLAINDYPAIQISQHEPDNCITPKRFSVHIFYTNQHPSDRLDTLTQCIEIDITAISL